MSVHLFVDTNVWLAFYAYSNDDIEQLNSLVGFIENKSLILYVSSQIDQEFRRNRDAKLFDSMNGLKVSANKSVPRFLMDLHEAEEFIKCANKYEKARNDLLQMANKGAVEHTFAVDGLIKKLFSTAVVSEISDEAIERARLRKEVGNPPGKNGSLGEQMNWEYLLEVVPEGAELHVVSKDSDYLSPLKNGMPHQFIIEEWERKKKSNLYVHQHLKPFLNSHFQSIKLKVDSEKDIAINDLLTSISFASTHLAIERLMPFFENIVASDANEILAKSLDNNQIAWIAGDDDVRNLYNSLKEKFSDQIQDELIEKWDELYKFLDKN